MAVGIDGTAAGMRERALHGVLPALCEGFSIIIPTYLNCAYVRKAVESLRRYSQLDHEIVLHISDGTDGTLAWADRDGLKYTHSTRNVGVCGAANCARRLCTRKVLVFFNDDMVALPEWDTSLARFASTHELGERISLSATVIEPRRTRKSVGMSPCGFGCSVAEFQEEELLRALPSLRARATDLGACTWAPNLLYAETWDRVGGFSEEYFPGWGSDVDLAKKLWDVGVRSFVGVGASLVYHFQCKTTGRLANPGVCERIFLEKHGITIDDFVNGVLGGRRPWRESRPASGQQ